MVILCFPTVVSDACRVLLRECISPFPFGFITKIPLRVRVAHILPPALWTCFISSCTAVVVSSSNMCWRGSGCRLCPVVPRAIVRRRWFSFDIAAWSVHAAASRRSHIYLCAINCRLHLYVCTSSVVYPLILFFLRDDAGCFFNPCVLFSVRSPAKYMLLFFPHCCCTFVITLHH